MDPSGIYFSQMDIFKPFQPPPFISTMNTVDPLYQMYMFTTQLASQNQQFIKQAALQSIISAEVSADLRSEGRWNLNPRIIITFVYLDHDEQEVFRKRPQTYLIKQIQEYFFQKKFHKEFTKDRIKSNGHGIVANWMFYQIRSDVNLRNEWNNYTNWAYKDYKPRTLQPMYYTDLSNNWFTGEFPITSGALPYWEPITYNTGNPNPQFGEEPAFLEYTTSSMPLSNIRLTRYIHSYVDPQYQLGNTDSGVASNAGQPFIWGQYIREGGTTVGAVNISKQMDKKPPYFAYSFKKNNVIPGDYFPYENGMNPYVTGPYQKANKNRVFLNWGLLLDGKLREDDLDAQYYNLVEPFLRSSGSLSKGLYTYNFGLNSDPFVIEPTGAMNLTRYKHIDYEYTSIGLDKINDISKVAILPICIRDEIGNLQPLGYNKTEWSIYNYTFDLKVMEEQYNLLTISNGLASLEFKSAN